jgi:tRNA nucleotidyltransferase (CCA-adding enzyme)
MKELIKTLTVDSIVSSDYYQDFLDLQKLLSLYTTRAYLVGGAVRDTLLNRQSSDFDIEIYDIPPKKLESIMSEFGAIGVGKHFHVYKHKNFDLALARRESKSGVGHTAFEVEVCDNECVAAKRRDFTMNAIMVNIFNNDVLDFYNGQKDIQSKTIRHIDNVTFVEDSLRTLRAMQFSARFAFKISNETICLIEKISISDLSKERIRNEFVKMFNADFLHFGLYYFYRLGIATQLGFPSLKFQDFVALRRFFKSAFVLKSQRRYLFCFALHQVLHLKKTLILEQLFLEREYRRSLQLQKRRPKVISSRFLSALSLHFSLDMWLGQSEEILKKSRELLKSDLTYYPNAKISEVIADGFERKEIKIEYKRRVSKEIRDNVK